MGGGHTCALHITVVWGGSVDSGGPVKPRRTHATTCQIAANNGITTRGGNINATTIIAIVRAFTGRTYGCHRHGTGTIGWGKLISGHIAIASRHYHHRTGIGGSGNRIGIIARTRCRTTAKAEINHIGFDCN